MRKLPVTMIIGILVVLVGLGASWTALRGIRAQPPDGALEASGRIEGEEVIVNSRVGGRVKQVLVKEGDPVTRGQLVAAIDSDELDAKVRQATAQIDAARAQADRASGEVGVLEAQLAQIRTAIALAEAQVAAQQRQAQAGLITALAREAQARKAWAMARLQAPKAVEESRAALRAAEADLARARAMREEARRELARLQNLHSVGAVAAMQVDAARTRADVASAQVDLAAEQVERARAALARTDAGTLEVQVREEEARGAAAQVEAARSQVTLARAAPLEVARQREQLRGVTRQVQIALAGRAAAQAQVAAAVAARDELQTVLNETRVAAPAAGVVTSKVVNPGEVVQAGTPLVVIVDLEALWLKVFIPEPDLGRLRLGMAARVSVDAFPDRSFEANVVEISQRAEFTPKDVQTREERVKQVFAVKLALQSAEGVLKPGMPADALIFWRPEALR